MTVLWTSFDNTTNTSSLSPSLSAALWLHIRSQALSEYKGDGKELQILLISSRRIPGQWVVPKGFVLKNLKETSQQTALRKALEEGGVKGLPRRSLGIFDDVETNSRIEVWSLEVTSELDDWPQAKERQRKWFQLEKIFEPEATVDFKKNVRPAVWLMINSFKEVYLPQSNQQPQAPSSNNSDSGLCNICMENPVDSVILDCAHSSVCLSCSKNLKNCPICRQPINKVIKIFKT